VRRIFERWHSNMATSWWWNATFYEQRQWMLNIFANTNMRGPNSYWMSGFVDIIYVAKCPLDKTMTFFCKSSSVCLSQRICDDSHIKVWMCVLEQLEQLRHVIMYLQFSMLTTRIYFPCLSACTSVPYGWNKGTWKEVIPSKVKNLIFRPKSWPRLNIEERIWPQKIWGQKCYQWKSFF
jgi:hypothetical protein